MSVSAEVNVIKAQCLAIIQNALVTTGNPVRYARGEAEGGWGAQVNTDLSVEFFDYVEGCYPPGTPVEELLLVELAYLTESAAEMLAASS